MHGDIAAPWSADTLAKEVALWLVAVNFGFVFDLDDFISSINSG